AWGMYMYPGTTGRTMPVFVPSIIFQDNSLPPLRIGDVISLVPVFADLVPARTSTECRITRRSR
ncbi:hypothetical protein, partial [Dietzia cinnamea]